MVPGCCWAGRQVTDGLPDRGAAQLHGEPSTELRSPERDVVALGDQTGSFPERSRS